MISSILRRLLHSIPFAIVERASHQQMFRRCHRQGTRGALDHAIASGLMVRSIIDVGAELGTWSVWNCFPQAGQLLIEPRLECLPVLEKHACDCRARGVEVHISCVAAGEVEGVAEFQVAAKGESSSLLGPADHTKPTQTVQVPVKTIDGLLLEHPLPHPFFLKIDAEGYDLQVLRGAVETLPKCSILMIEGTPKQRQAGACKMSELLNFMESRDWVLFDIISVHYDGGNNLDHFDLLFAPAGSPVLKGFE